LNFALSYSYNIVARKLVKWENHPFEKERRASEITKTVLFKLFSSHLTLTVMLYFSIPYGSDQEPENYRPS
jgi:hypothetical protein